MSGSKSSDRILYTPQFTDSLLGSVFNDIQYQERTLSKYFLGQVISTIRNAEKVANPPSTPVTYRFNIQIDSSQTNTLRERVDAIDRANNLLKKILLPEEFDYLMSSKSEVRSIFLTEDEKALIEKLGKGN